MNFERIPQEQKLCIFNGLSRIWYNWK